MSNGISQALRGAFALTPRRIRQLWYAPLLALAMALMMLRLLVLARLLSLSSFAQFNVGLLVSGSFCMLGCLGLQSMLQREWPVHLIRGRELAGVVRAMQCVLVASACFAIGLLAILGGLSLNGLSPALLAVGLLHGVSQQVFLIATIESRSRGDSLRFSRQNLWRSAGAFLLGIAVAAWTGDPIATLLTDAVVTGVLSVVYFRRSVVSSGRRAASVLRLAIRGLRTLRWKSALTLTLMSAAGFGMLNADRWLASGRLDLSGFAVYSFAWIVLSLAQSVQVVVNASIYPLLARRFAAGGRADAFRVCRKVSLTVLLGGAVLVVPAGLLLAGAISRWYPQYAAATGLLPVFLVTALLRISDFWSSFLLITGFESLLLRLQLGVGVASALLWTGIVRPWGDGAIDPQAVAWLAALLTAGLYVAVVGSAWRVRNP